LEVIDQPTAGFSGGRGIWQEKAKGRTRFRDRIPSGAGQRPRPSAANGVGHFLNAQAHCPFY